MAVAVAIALAVILAVAVIVTSWLLFKADYIKPGFEPGSFIRYDRCVTRSSRIASPQHSRNQSLITAAATACHNRSHGSRVIIINLS